MKKISNVEVRLINLQSTDVIATSARFGSDTNVVGVGARDYYDDEEDF